VWVREKTRVLRWCEEKRKEGRFDPHISTAGVNMVINIVNIEKQTPPFPV